MNFHFSFQFGYEVLVLGIIVLSIEYVTAQMKLNLSLKDEKSGKLKSQIQRKSTDIYSPSKSLEPLFSEDPYSSDNVRDRRKSNNKNVEDSERYIDSYKDFVMRNFGDVFSENYKNDYEKADYIEDDSKEQESNKKSEAQKHDDDDEDHDYSYRAADEYEKIRAQSQKQAMEIQEDPGNCKVVHKDDMDCKVCYNRKTGDKSESCSYASEPKSKKYAYVNEKKYNSKDDPELEENQQESEDENEEREELEPIKRENYDIAKPKRKSQIVHKRRHNRQPGQSGIDHEIIGPILLHSKTQEPIKFEKLTLHTDDDIFPAKLVAENSTQSHGFDNDFASSFSIDAKPTDVDRALDEFNKKDWKGCVKKYKNELTCYQCKSQNGMKHEECMYISDSKPKSQKVAPSQEKGDRIKKSEKLQVAQTKYYEPAVTQYKKSKFPKKVHTMKIPKLAKKVNKAVEKKPEVGDSERRTVKRKVSYRVQEDGNKDDPHSLGRAMRYEHFVSHRV